MYKIPSDIQLILSGNLIPSTSTVYLNEYKEDIYTLIKSIKEFNFRYYKFKFHSNEILKTGQFLLIEVFLTKIANREDSKEVKGTFYILEDLEEAKLFIFTKNNIRFMNKAIHVFMNHYFYPQISRVYLTSKEIFDLLVGLEKLIKSQLLCRVCSGKGLFAKIPETIVSYQKGKKLKNFKEAFEKALDDNKWVHYIYLESHSKDYGNIKFSISRDGNIHLINGKFELLVQLIYNIYEIGDKWSKVLKEREIKPKQRPKPILLKYKSNILSEKENRERLIEEISNYHECSYSIIHGGNPHIYMYILDRLDKSSFSLRSLGGSTLLVTPQLMTTYASLMRFIDHLVQNFSEYDEMNEIGKD